MKGSNGRKDRDEDLLLFRELHKREKDSVASLLQPVSDEFEPNGGNYALYRIASGKKGSAYELYGENDKSDYNWLKTPPATPLFPSLEMEANATQLVLQRELPIAQPPSRFAGSAKVLSKPNTGSPKSPNNSKLKMIPLRPVTLGSKRSSQTNNTNVINPELTHPSEPTNTSKSNKQKETQTAARIYIAGTGSDSKRKPISSSLRSKIPVGFSSDTPPNLKTDRATSATRSRPVASNLTASTLQKPLPSRRQSCSPSVTRGRKENEDNFVTRKGKIQNGTHMFGSRIVDKVMNVRKLSTQERGQKPKLQTTATSDSGTTFGTDFGRMIMSRSSLDMALNQLEKK
ncbi:uncharacterized protein LOC105639486 isoform X2 [Jatropha curcas]|uniref:uncharacterized protein LOC105639486 isoform X2 n=1 Tax=Jatropha curcas TaxID=180498 RepID=UPI0009D7182D|nr:uncharacterized protein LOC105639486 isoform X2 [Jatropha curcas]